MMRLRAFATLLTAVAGLALFAIAQPAHAIPFANFNQTQNAPPAFTVTGTNFTGVNLPVDWTFLVPPGNSPTFLFTNNSSPTVGAFLNITRGGLVGVATQSGTTLLQDVNFDYSFTVRPPINNNSAAAPTGFNLLTGTLIGRIIVSQGGTVATMQFPEGLMPDGSWNSAALYDVGTGNRLAQALGGYSGAFTLNGIGTNTSIVGGNIVGIGSVTSVTGGFSATPEPASMILLALGLAGVPAAALIRRRLAKA